jgi:predicted Zn-dependent protease
MLASTAICAEDKAAPKRASQKTIDMEMKLGDEAAASAEKTLKLIKIDPNDKGEKDKVARYAARVEEIGQKMAAIAKVEYVTATYGSPDLADFPYSFKVVDDKDVNAFSLPGGRVYVNKGLLERAESEDELAAVIAHEVAHIAHHHLLQLLKKQGQYDAMVFAIIAAAVISKSDAADVQNVMYGAKLFEIAKLNAYSQDAEDDADRTAIEYLVKAGYNPVGMMTFMEKLARDQQFDPIDPGILQNHPLSRDRVERIAAQIRKHGIPINRRAVTTASIAVVRDTKANDKAVSEVAIGSRPIIQVADAARAKAIADALNKALDHYPAIRDVRLDVDGTQVFIKEELVVDIRQQDADLAAMTREELAEKVRAAIQAVLVSQGLDMMY